MKHRLFALGLIAVLAGCAGSSLADKVKAVQDEAVKICAYLPTANSVAAIMTAGDPKVIGISAVANAICNAVTAWHEENKTHTFVMSCPKVNGVCVEGEFTKLPKGN